MYTYVYMHVLYILPFIAAGLMGFMVFNIASIIIILKLDFGCHIYAIKKKTIPNKQTY